MPALVQLQVQLRLGNRQDDPQDPAVRIEHVSKRSTADGPIVQEDLSLEVNPGEFVSIVGASGCGKSTLLNLLAGLDKPTSGSIFTSDRPTLIFQGPALMPWLTAGRNVELALYLRGGFSRAERRAHVPANCWPW